MKSTNYSMITGTFQCIPISPSQTLRSTLEVIQIALPAKSTSMWTSVCPYDFQQVWSEMFILQILRAKILPHITLPCFAPTKQGSTFNLTHLYAETPRRQLVLRRKLASSVIQCWLPLLPSCKLSLSMFIAVYNKFWFIHKQNP